MEDQVNLPHDIYTRLIDAAQHEGTTPAGWIEQHLPPTVNDRQQVQTATNKPKNMLEALGDAVGSIRSGGKLRAAELHSQLLAEGLEEKRRQGRL